MGEKMLKISHVENSTELLGPYSRFAIWVHGCCFDCPGCLAENTKHGGYVYKGARELAEEAASRDAEGITVSGGEPFMQAEALLDFFKCLRTKRDMGIILYTGFTLEELKEDPRKAALLPYIDILIDGRYIKELDDGRAFVGSSNQKIYYLTERYKEIGKSYYGYGKRKAEIKFTKDEAVLIGVPSKEALKIWKEIKKKAGGVVSDF